MRGLRAWQGAALPYTLRLFRMIYPFLDLRTVAWIVGVLLVALHGLALVKAESVRAWLRRFPRSAGAGTTLLLVDAVWAFWLVADMDLGEFSYLRRTLMIFVPVAAYLTWRFVDEFLAVRALGMLLLLAAEPVIEAAFLRPETSRLLLVVLAYAWAVIGMFWIGMPYLLRDQIAALQKTNARWQAGCAAGLLYGIAVLGCAVTLHG